jgi:hypothetical protein
MVVLSESPLAQLAGVRRDRDLVKPEACAYVKTKIGNGLAMFGNERLSFGLRFACPSYFSLLLKRPPAGFFTIAAVLESMSCLSRTRFRSREIFQNKMIMRSSGLGINKSLTSLNNRR